MKTEYFVLLEKGEKQRRAHYEQTQAQLIARYGQAAWDAKKVILGYRHGKPVVCHITPSNPPMMKIAPII